MNSALPTHVDIHTRPPTQDGRGKSRIWGKSKDFYCAPSKGRKKGVGVAPYLLLGFDTEFKTPDQPVTREEIVAGEAKYLVLSYQFHAKTSDGKEWQGICCPEGDERISLGQFLAFALGAGAREHGIRDIPTTIYMVGHFTRADIPAFSDFQDMTAFLSNVRRTFMTVDLYKKYSVPVKGGKPIDLRVYFRDTMNLAPAGKQSLKAIGELVGVPKMQLDPDIAKHNEMIKHMDVVRATNWELFRDYAINDAKVCVRYIEQIIDLYHAVTGKKKVPLTLTSIGVDLFLKSCKEGLNLDHLAILGKEEHRCKEWDDKRRCYMKKKVTVPMEEVHRHTAFVTECFHGGRNEQFWFGPGFDDQCSDWDFASAYATAMSLIGLPDWRATRVTHDIDDFHPASLGFAHVAFEFPPGTRYPTLPVRTDNGLVFPLTGESHCAAPELCVARNLGAKLTIKYGVIVPTNPDIKIFGPFITECLERRIKAGPKTLNGLLWKEIGNSTYGKTAQGLQERRVYDLRERKTQPMPESRITNAFFAAFITSFIRAVLGEVINSLGDRPYVFNATTDGFLTNASPEEVAGAQRGPLARLFSASKLALTGDPKVLEVKHAIRRPLGWRTRGQATLVPGTDAAGASDSNYVLAKGGIYSPKGLETKAERNDYIVNLFFTRTPETLIDIPAKTGVREIVEYNADFVEKIITKHLGMEFDWKRRPLALGWSERYQHILYSTQPWHSVDQFIAVRNSWDEYAGKPRVCIKTMDQFEGFATYIDSHAGMPKEHARFLRRDQPDLKRLRALLCSAWRHSKAGLTWKANEMSASKFATRLSMAGIPCTKADVENGLKRPFKPNSCPPTALVREKLHTLTHIFPMLRADEFLHISSGPEAVSIRPTGRCAYVDRAVAGDRCAKQAVVSVLPARRRNAAQNDAIAAAAA